MKTSNPKKILVAFDGSEHALEAVRYASTALNPKTTDVILYHVLRKIDEAFWHIGMKPAVSEKMIDIKGWEAAQDTAVTKFMDEARRIFTDNGFPEDKVKTEIHPCEQGVARDILKESSRGYQGVLLGRKGVSGLKDLILGGTAQKLIEKTAHIPVCIVGKGACAGNLLLAVDASEGALKAVDYTATMFGDTDSRIRLVHVQSVIGSLEPRYGFTYPEAVFIEDGEWLEAQKQDALQLLEKAKRKLIAAGVDETRISTSLLTDTGSRARAVVRDARESGSGGIVIGRRGISKIEAFLMGSMSHKVVQMGTETAVWVVS